MSRRRCRAEWHWLSHSGPGAAARCVPGTPPASAPPIVPAPWRPSAPAPSAPSQSQQAYTGAPVRISHICGLDPFRAAALSTVSNPSLSVSGPRRPRAKAPHGRHGSACFEAAGSHPRRRDDSLPRKRARDTPAPVLSEHPSPVIDPCSTRNQALPARLAAPRLRTWFQMA